MFGTKFFPMYPGGTTVSWHQDNHYFGTNTTEIVTLALYLEDTTIENGCLRVVPRSHRLAKDVLPHAPGQGVWSQGEWLPNEWFEKEAVDVQIPAGTAVFFSPMLVHSARPNSSKLATRKSVFWHYVPSDVIFEWRGIDFSRDRYKDRHVVDVSKVAGGG